MVDASESSGDAVSAAGSQRMRIGTFSRVSARLLRHYHAVGLLVPAAVDGNGYRRYEAAQLTDLHRILALRDLGLSLDQIRDLIDRGLPQEESREMLTLLEAETERARATADERLRSIRARVDAIDTSVDDEPLEMRTFDDTSFRSLTGTFVPTEARAVVRTLFAYAENAGFEPPVVAARWLGPFETDEWELEIGLMGVEASTEEPVELEDSVLPSGSFVSTVRTLAADRAHHLYGAVPNYCAAHDLELNGELREFVVAMPAPDSGTEPTVEVQFGVSGAHGSAPHT